MQLTIKSGEAHKLATELARLKGETLTVAVIRALEERLARESKTADRSAIVARVMEIGRQYSALPDADTRTADEILGYDENGLPT